MAVLHTTPLLEPCKAIANCCCYYFLKNKSGGGGRDVCEGRGRGPSVKLKWDPGCAPSRLRHGGSIGEGGAAKRCEMGPACSRPGSGGTEA